MARRLRYFGAAAILRAGASMLLQRKTEGYPFAPYVGKTTLVGGVWSSPEDRAPRETVERELREELRPPKVHAPLLSGLRFFRTFDYRLPELDDDQGAFWARSYIFESEIGDPDLLREVELTEGEGEFVGDIRGYDGEMCWGHDATLREWGSARGYRIELEGTVAEVRSAADEEPESYRDENRSQLVHDPLDGA